MSEIGPKSVGPPLYRVDRVPRRDPRWAELPAEFTHELGSRMLEGIRSGHDPVVVATRHGIPVHTFRSWLEMGGDGVEPYASFTRRVLQCRSEFECELVDVLAAAAREDPVWAHKFLEKIAPARWSEKAKKEITIRGEFRLQREHEVNKLLEHDDSVLDAILDSNE